LAFTKGPLKNKSGIISNNLASSPIQLLPRVALMHVLGGGTRQYESDEKRIGAVRQLMTQHNASVFSALSSDILVTDIPVQAGDEWPHVVPETRSVFHPHNETLSGVAMCIWNENSGHL
jgi:hypothetical protein